MEEMEGEREVDENNNLCSQEKEEWTEEQWQHVTEARKKGKN